MFIGWANIDIDSSVKLKPIQDRSLLYINFTDQKDILAVPNNDKNVTELVLKLNNDTETQKSYIAVNRIFLLPEQKFTRSIIAGGKEYFPEYDINGSDVVENIELPVLINKLLPAEPLEVQIGNSLERIKKITRPFNEIITGLAATGGVIIGVIYHEKIKKGANNTKNKCSNAGSRETQNCSCR
jgi:hypothetical protein